MCALCAIWHLQACLADNVHLHDVRTHVYTRLQPFGFAPSCRHRGAKVQRENHSDKLLRENFTTKRIFRPKVATYVAEAAWLPHAF